MNILTDALPELIEIDGIEWTLSTDFRVCLRIILAFEDDELTGQEKQMVMLQNLYPKMPDNLDVAAAQAMKFLNGGETRAIEDAPLRLYSFAKDANLIFAAFRQTHGVDLEREDMHWWKFLALFMDLGAETTFCNLVALRKRLKTGKATKEERQVAQEMGDMVEVPEPDTRTPEQKQQEDEFMQLVTGGRT